MPSCGPETPLTIPSKQRRVLLRLKLFWDLLLIPLANNESLLVGLSVGIATEIASYCLLEAEAEILAERLLRSYVQDLDLETLSLSGLLRSLAARNASS